MKHDVQLVPRRDFLGAAGFGLLAAALPRTAAGATAASPASWPDADEIVRRLRPPVFPARTYRLTDFGAPGDLRTDARPGLLEAIRRCNNDGGGRVLVPAGTWWLNGPVHLKSGVDLHLEAGATLRFNPDPKLYLPPVLTRWEGTEVYNYSPCIYAYQARHVAITGRGTIDGQGGGLCVEWRKQQRPDRDLLRKMGAEGAPVFQRVFGEGHWLRFGLIQFFGCSQVLLEDFTAMNSGFWCVHTVASEHVTVRRLRIDAPHLNNDCFDPESSSEVLIEDCVFRSGDDCIAIKAGRDQDAWRVGRPAENIVIRNCELHSVGAAAVAIGSEMSGGVRNVHVENCRIGRARQAFNFKGNLDRGGTVEHVRVRGITIDAADHAINFTLDYQGLRSGGHPPRFRDFELSDLRCRETGTAIAAVAVPGAEFTDVRIRDFTATKADRPVEIRHVRNFTLENVRINGAETRLPAPDA
jgi:polygalacturonase